MKQIGNICPFSRKECLGVNCKLSMRMNDTKFISCYILIVLNKIIIHGFK